MEGVKTQGEGTVMTEAEIGETHLQAQEPRCRNDQELEEAGRTLPSSPQRECGRVTP